MRKNKFLFLNKLLLVLSLIGLLVSFAIGLNHSCVGEECEICYLLSVISLSLIVVLLLSSFCLLVYFNRLLSGSWIYHQKDSALIQKPAYKKILLQDISLITLKIKLQVACK